MPKTLIVIRHSKAAWPDDVADHERPLHKRGRRDAPAIGHWLASNELRPDSVVVSSALRTRQTYELIAAQLASAPAATLSDEVYNAGAGDLLDVVRSLGDAVDSTLLIGHNPSVGTLANLLDDESTDVAERSRMRLEFPTSAVAAFQVDGPWSATDPGSARLIAFAVPRA